MSLYNMINEKKDTTENYGLKIIVLNIQDFFFV